ncbi:DUF4129 domain-containing protein [Desulfobacter postgatei]|jgi:hypothetical protein|uniref:DUF4129 domain-containing protein n=1 Tax=Desulfobacter postgatei TaxID=2293 RepID=UPI002A358799|nr:DUF4129 domain-containing protein [Desulfobacter postgatei]MDX9964843.1 DUF4129 domain-containing protein [Desulfobacter postgatei]
MGFFLQTGLHKEKSNLHEQDHYPSAPFNHHPDFYIQKLEKKLARSGFERKPHETYEQFFMRVKEKTFSPQDIPSLMTVIRIHKQLRFGPRPISGNDLAILEAETDRLISKAVRSRQVGPGQIRLRNRH